MAVGPGLSQLLDHLKTVETIQKKLNADAKHTHFVGLSIVFPMTQCDHNIITREMRKNRRNL